MPSKDDRFRNRLREVQASGSYEEVSIQKETKPEKLGDTIKQAILKLNWPCLHLQKNVRLGSILLIKYFSICLSYFRYTFLQEWMGFRELSAGLKRQLVTYYVESWRRRLSVNFAFDVLCCVVSSIRHLLVEFMQRYKL